MKKPEIGLILPFNEIPAGVILYFDGEEVPGTFERITCKGVPYFFDAVRVHKTEGGWNRVKGSSCDNRFPISPFASVKIIDILPPEYRLESTKHANNLIIVSLYFGDELVCTQATKTKQAANAVTQFIAGVYAHLGVWLEPPVWPEE